MEGRRRQKWDSCRRSQNRRPPRRNCSWQPTVPCWEKEFCRVIGSLDWETLLQMKKYIHLYENVINWDDSAGEEAFSNAKKRFWAELNGLPCNIPLPDPDHCIDKIDWDSEIDPNLIPDLDSEPLNSNQDEEHETVVTFGDSLFQGQAYSATGWGDDDENFQVPTKSSSGNQPLQNWCSSFGNGVAIGWPSPSYYNNGWQFGDGNVNLNQPSGYMAWGSGWNDWGWSYTGNNVMYEMQPDTDHTVGDQVQEQGLWNDNVGRTASTHKTPRVQDKDLYLNSHHAAIAVGQAWNQ